VMGFLKQASESHEVPRPGGTAPNLGGPLARRITNVSQACNIVPDPGTAARRGMVAGCLGNQADPFGYSVLMPVESVYPELEPLLPRVRKPVQYVGGEVGAVVKDWDGTDVRWALCYPDAYEVGLPNQGVQILYEVLNERDGVLAERTYCVWPD